MSDYTVWKNIFDADTETWSTIQTTIRYFLLLQETNISSHCYQRVGIGAVWGTFWPKNTERKVVNIE